MSSTTRPVPALPWSGAAPPGGRRWLTLAVLGVSLLVVGLDTTVLNVALPTLVSELGASTSQLQWIVDSYLLMAGSLVLFCGSLADRLGRKWVFMTGLALFTTASVVAAYAGSVTTLVVARGVMGVGEALIMPATLAIIGNVFPRGAERTKAIGIWSAAVGVGTVIGPMVGGWLLGTFWWGSVFLINLPIGIAGLIAAGFLVPNSKAADARRLDPAGALLSVAGVAAVLWAVIEGPDRGWTSSAVLTAFAAGAVLAGAFIAWQRRGASPMLPLRIFRHQALAAGDVLILLGAFALIGTLFVVVQYFQFVLGYSAAQTGLRLGPAALALLIAGPLAGVLAPRIGMRAVSAAGLALLLGSSAVLATTGTGDGYGRALVAMLLLGAGAGFVITSTSDAIVGSLPEADLGVGSATNSASIQLGAAAGVAVAGSLLSDRYRSGLAEAPHSAALPPELLASAQESVGTALAIAEKLPGETGAAVADAARRAFTDGMGPAMAAAVGVTAVGIAVALAFAPSRPTDPATDRRTNSEESS
ncbi:DHA2 family efflux MFS transporter permease subunit [Streptomyces sp. ME08-AFT2]|uniref:DHA2 family efflux MFS transporter permease subunit n=1 Tax=Streptomyces sp. ME08-AFT2 TaxID=3028683 RepID=UPI0029B681F9|nr:DHA2 family efflux MFS transporter permease subunit [Streptomyces sp. ME08-AFT2]MDX3308099.1 DHA2 family efflux MFS transporter permease subunit [Streptomyces sp. ME08-AFT2]